MLHRFINLAEKSCDLIFDAWVYAPQMKWEAPKVIAHRGAWDLVGCHENTMLAFEKARMLGVYGIEFDVHFTKDDVPVVHHDPSLSRIFKYPGLIKDMTLKKLRAVTPDVPTVEEVLALEGVHFMIEIKTEMSPKQMKILDSCLQGKEAVRDYHFLAIDPGLVRESSGMPSACWVLVGELNLRSRIDLAIDRKMAGVAGHYLGLSKKSILRLHDHGLKAGVGFVPTQNMLYREWQRQVDWAFTNSASRIL